MFTASTKFARKLTNREKMLLQNTRHDNELVEATENRLDFIFRQILKSLNLTDKEIDNCDFMMQIENADSSIDDYRGYYDSQRHSNKIGIFAIYPAILETESFIFFAIKEFKFLKGIPTNWLFEDFDDELAVEAKILLQKFSYKNKSASEYDRIKTSILSKLTDEELSIIYFNPH